MESVVLAANRIFGRLFDHRGAVQGEIAFMVQEFEPKHQKELSNSNFNAMLSEAEALLSDTFPEILNISKAHLEDIFYSAKAAEQMCDVVLKNGGRSLEAETLSRHREERKQQWAHFMNEQCEKSAQVDQEYAAQVQSIESFYANLEKKQDTSGAVPLAQT